MAGVVVLVSLTVAEEKAEVGEKSEAGMMCEGDQGGRTGEAGRRLSLGLELEWIIVRTATRRTHDGYISTAQQAVCFVRLRWCCVRLTGEPNQRTTAVQRASGRWDVGVKSTVRWLTVSAVGRC